MTDPVVIKHKVLFVRAGAKQFRPLATRAANDPNADEDFQALRLQTIIDASRSGAERPEFGVGLQTATDGQNGTPTVITFEGFSPQGKIEKASK